MRQYNRAIKTVTMSFLGIFVILTTYANAQAMEKHEFYLYPDNVTTKDALIGKIQRGEFRVGTNVLREQINRAADVNLMSKDELVSFIASNDVSIVPCDWNSQASDVAIEYVAEGKSLGTFSRKCYPGELTLTYKGRVFFSLACGNPIIDMREPAPVAVSQLPEHTIISCKPVIQIVPHGSVVGFMTGVEDSSTGVMSDFELPTQYETQSAYCQ